MNIDDDTGPYTERQKQILRDAVRHLVRPAPVVKGGQGRSADDVRASADALTVYTALTVLAGIVAGLCWLAGRR